MTDPTTAFFYGVLVTCAVLGVLGLLVAIAPRGRRS